MRIIIAGCGRVGAELAVTLSVAGHDVVVIDKDPTAFRRLPSDFAGKTLTGFAFDRPTLEAAGVRQAQAFIAVTSGDNSNIVSARTAKERFGVPNAIARIYDPARAAIYERLGITTIASARWTADAVLRALLPPEERVEAGLGPGYGDVVLLRLRVPNGAHAVPASALERSGEVVLAAVTREGATRVPTEGALLEAGDELHLVVQRPVLDEVRAKVAALGEEPE